MYRLWLLFLELLAVTVITRAAHVDHKTEFSNCDDLHCVDPIWVKGPCSLICPQGQTCRHPRHGTVLKANIEYDIDGQKCKCQDKTRPDWDIAKCKD